MNGCLWSHRHVALQITSSGTIATSAVCQSCLSSQSKSQRDFLRLPLFQVLFSPLTQDFQDLENMPIVDHVSSHTINDDDTFWGYATVRYIDYSVHACNTTEEWRVSKQSLAGASQHLRVCVQMRIPLRILRTYDDSTNQNHSYSCGGLCKRRRTDHSYPLHLNTPRGFNLPSQWALPGEDSGIARTARLLELCPKVESGSLARATCPPGGAPSRTCNCPSCLLPHPCFPSSCSLCC